MAEEQRISPAIVIAAGAGIASAVALGIYAIARAAAPTPPPEGYACPYCPATFSTHEELADHVQSEHPEVPEPLTATPPVLVENAKLPTWCSSCWKVCSLSVTNISSYYVPCSVALYARYFSSATDYKWTDWRELLPKNLLSWRNTVSDYPPALEKYNQLTMLEATLAPGETKVFSGVVPTMTKKVTGMPRMWVKFVGPFGEVLAAGYFLMVEYGY